MPPGSVQLVTDGILIDIDDAASAPERIPFGQGAHRNEVIRLLGAHTVVGRALARRKRALTHGAQQPRNAAIGSTTDQMSTEAALTVMRALWMGTVTCGELHGSLLIQTVCRVSGVYSECSRLSFVFIHAIEGQHRKACRQRNYIETYSNALSTRF